MATTWAQVIDDIRRKAPTIPRSVAVLTLQRAANDLDARFSLTRDIQVIPLVGGTQFYAIDEDVLRIWDADLQHGAQNATRLSQMSLRAVDISDVISNQNIATFMTLSGSPTTIYLHPTATGGRQIAISPAPANDSMNVTGATNATPIVITTDIDHGLSDSFQVTLAGVLGNLAANGTYYAKVTGYSDTTFALFEDSALAVPIAGSGGYTPNTGVVGSAARPFGRLHVSRQITVADDSTEIPESLNNYIKGLKWWALDDWFKGGEGTPDQRAEAQRELRYAKAEMGKSLLADVRQETRPFCRQRYVVR